MSSPIARFFRKNLRDIIWNLSLIAMGSVLCAVAIKGILIPQQFVSSGFTGLCIIIYYLFPSFPLGLLYFVLNIPVFIMGWKFVGRRFFIYSVVGMLIFAFAVQYLHFSVAVKDPILSALLAGIITGVGSGIILRSAGSVGGTDILSVILIHRFSIRLGTTLLAFNSGLLLLTAFIISVEGAIYTLIFLYVSSRIINLVVTGLSQRKVVFIISSSYEKIHKAIMRDLTRGVTIMYGEGGYTRQKGRIIYTVITFHELPRLKQIIKRFDPDAFVVVSETLEVMGHRIGNQPHW